MQSLNQTQLICMGLVHLICRTTLKRFHKIFQGIVPAMSNVYVHFSQISFPARYLVVNFQLLSRSLRFREVILLTSAKF